MGDSLADRREPAQNADRTFLSELEGAAKALTIADGGLDTQCLRQLLGELAHEAARDTAIYGLGVHRFGKMRKRPGQRLQSNFRYVI